MKKLFVIGAALLMGGAALADDTVFQKMQALYVAKTTLEAQLKTADKAGGFGMVIKPSDASQRATVVWVAPGDPEWSAVLGAFKSAANRQANAASAELDKYKVTAPPEEKPDAKK